MLFLYYFIYIFLYYFMLFLRTMKKEGIIIIFLSDTYFIYCIRVSQAVLLVDDY